MATGFGEGSSNSRERFVYQVFLSFRGGDVRRTFIGHLHHALEQRRINTFYDDSGLPRGDDIQSKLYKAIETSRLSIVTFSPGYATSRWCLDELVKIMECKKSHGHIVLPVFYGVEPTDLRHQSGPYQEAFEAHEVRFKNELHRVKKWREALSFTADLAGYPLQNQANGIEAQLIERIVLDVGNIVDTRPLSVPKYMVGRESLIQKISVWLQNESSEVEVGIIYGIGGVGKTTTAMVVYNGYRHQFESSSFLADIRSATSQKDENVIRLQEQLIFNISGNKATKIYNVHEGKEMIRRAIGPKKILVVLDDVDDLEHLHELFGCPEWFFPGSKILITTRNQHLLNAVGATTIAFKVRVLNVENSTELFCHHAFGQSYPPQDYTKIAKLFINYCDGLPLALKVLASSLRNKTLAMWERDYVKLKDFPNQTVHNVLKLSFESINDSNDEDIFLHIAFFMVGMKKGRALTILDGCNLHGMIGLENLMDKCLVSVDEYCGILRMHHLIQQMGYEVVRQKARIDLGQRSRLLGRDDTSEVLRKRTGTSAIKGLQLDYPDSNDEISAEETYVEHKRSATYVEHSITGDIRYKRCANPSRRFPHKLRPIETSAFSKMCNLDILLLENVQHEGDFKDFPKMIKWLSWRGFSLKSIPLDFELDDLIVLDMQKSCLVHAWEGSKLMWALRVLNLSHSHRLESTPDLSGAIMLERIYLEGCKNLIELHESIGSLENLTHLNMEGCSGLVRMHKSIEKLKKLTVLNLKGCISLRRFPIDKLCSFERLNLHDCQSFFMAPDSMESSVSSPNTCLMATASSLPQYRVPSTSLQSALSCSLPFLTDLCLGRCGISDDNVLEWLSQARSLNYVDLSGNPIRMLNNKHMFTFPRLRCIDLDDCSELQSISQLPHHPMVILSNCSSLKRISYIYNNCFPWRRMSFINEPDTWEHYDFVPGCDELVEIDYGCKNIQVFEWTRDMDGSQATTLGFPNLESFDFESNLEFPMSNFFDYGRGNYLGGIYQVYLPGDHLAKWFAELTTSAELHYCVPSNGLPIRALNLGFVVSSYYRTYGTFGVYSVTIKNLTSMWKWTLRSGGDWQNIATWLSHWCVMKHREIKPGDLLVISVSDPSQNYHTYIFNWGIKVIYEEQHVDEDKLEQHDTISDDGECSSNNSQGQIINLHDKTKNSLRDERKQKEEEDGSTADVAFWYNDTFRSPLLDLSIFKNNRRPDTGDESFKSRTYELLGHMYTKNRRAHPDERRGCRTVKKTLLQAQRL